MEVGGGVRADALDEEIFFFFFPTDLKRISFPSPPVGWSPVLQVDHELQGHARHFYEVHFTLILAASASAGNSDANLENSPSVGAIARRINH